MKYIFSATLCLFLTGFFVVGFSESAHAYIDLGTGSMIFQMIVAGLVGATFTIKMYWYKIKTKIRRLLGHPEPEMPPQAPASLHQEDHHEHERKED